MVKAVLAMSPTDQSSELPIIMMIAGNGWNCENGKKYPNKLEKVSADQVAPDVQETRDPTSKKPRSSSRVSEEEEGIHKVP